jgi:hypothetical protein
MKQTGLRSDPSSVFGYKNSAVSWTAPSKRNLQRSAQQFTDKLQAYQSSKLAETIFCVSRSLIAGGSIVV